MLPEANNRPVFMLLVVALIAGASSSPSSQKKEILIEPLSATSLYLRLYTAGQPVSTATGFVVKWQQRHYLITNWHVVSGRDPTTGKQLDAKGRVPDSVAVVHHAKELGKWVEQRAPLIDSGRNVWIEHALGKGRDVVALRLPDPVDPVHYYPLDFTLADVDMIPAVAMPVSIVGFPLGLTGPGMFPIWKTGHIASEPMLDYQGAPVFLIDATTRGGMSGSPVVLRLAGGYGTAAGGRIMTTSGYRTRFLGVYSGRISPDSEVGMVWRPSVITEILERTK